VRLRRLNSWRAAAAALLLVVACGEDDGVEPTPFTGQTVTIDVPAGDWQTSALYDPVADQTTTTGWVGVTASLDEISAGDAVRVTVNLVDPLVSQVDLGESVDFYVRIGQPTSYLEWTSAPPVKFTVESWTHITDRTVAFYAGFPNIGRISFISVLFSMSLMTKDERLTRVFVEFKVPDMIGSEPMAPNQTIAFRSVDWIVQESGDHRTDPPPIAPSSP
jgi:hypothetical protein